MDALATNLEGMEEVARQSDFRAGGYDPKCGRRGKGFGFSVPINLTHSHVSREKKPVAQEPKAVAPVAPAVEKSQPADVVLIKGNTRHFEPFRIVEDYDALCDALAERVEDLQATRLGVDAAGRFAGGHASTLLCRPQIKGYGPISLTRMLKATGLVIVLAIDDERFAKVKDRLIRRERPPRPAVHKPTAAQSAPAGLLSPMAIFSLVIEQRTAKAGENATQEKLWVVEMLRRAAQQIAAGSPPLSGQNVPEAAVANPTNCSYSFGAGSLNVSL